MNIVGLRGRIQNYSLAHWKTACNFALKDVQAQIQRIQQNRNSDIGNRLKLVEGNLITINFHGVVLGMGAVVNWAFIATPIILICLCELRLRYHPLSWEILMKQTHHSDDLNSSFS